MKTEIRNAIVFSAELPTAAQLAINLQTAEFVEAQPFEAGSTGFIRHEGALVSEFQAGFAFHVRIDEKIIPAQTVNAETDKIVKKTLEQTGRTKIGKKERKEIKEGVILHLRTVALTKTNVVTVFYNIDKQYLIVPTTSKKVADIIITKLIHATSSVKTTTIHVSDVKQGLTTRLESWLAGNGDAFDDYYPHETVVMADFAKNKISVDMESLINAQEALNDAIKKGFRVSSIGLSTEGLNYRLTDDFHLRGIEVSKEEGEAIQESWAHEASVQTIIVSSIVSDMCEMFGYKPPETEAVAE